MSRTTCNSNMSEDFQRAFPGSIRHTQMPIMPDSLLPGLCLSCQRCRQRPRVKFCISDLVRLSWSRGTRPRNRIVSLRWRAHSTGLCIRNKEDVMSGGLVDPSPVSLRGIESRLRGELEVDLTVRAGSRLELVGERFHRKKAFVVALGSTRELCVWVAGYAPVPVLLLLQARIRCGTFGNWMPFDPWAGLQRSR